MSDKQQLAGGFGFPLGFATAIVVVLGAAAIGALAHPVAVLVALACATAAVSALTTMPAALGTALVSWGLYTGFVTGHLGQLQFTGAGALAAGVLLLVAVAASGVMTALRHHVSRPHARVDRVAQVAPPVQG